MRTQTHGAVSAPHAERCAHAEWAKAQGLGVLVMNPNHRDTRSEEHVIAAWDEFVLPAAAEHVVMVAHSFGGVCLGALLDARRDAVTARLRAVALTDSVHGRSVERLPAAQREFWVANCINWVTSDDPLDTPVRAAVHNPPDAGDESDHDHGARSDGSDEDEEEADAAPVRCVCASLMQRRVASVANTRHLQQAQGALAVGAAVVRLRARVCWPPRARVDKRGLPPERVRVLASQAAGRWLGAAKCSGTHCAMGCFAERSVNTTQCLPSAPALVDLFLGLERDKP